MREELMEECDRLGLPFWAADRLLPWVEAHTAEHRRADDNIPKAGRHELVAVNGVHVRCTAAAIREGRK